MNEYEQVALTKIREAYGASKPVINDIMLNHVKVSAMVAMFRSAIILNPQSKPEDIKPLVDYLDAIASHMESMLGVMTALHGLAMTVNAIMSEHEEEPLAQLLDEKWEGAD